MISPTTTVPELHPIDTSTYDTVESFLQKQRMQSFQFYEMSNIDVASVKKEHTHAIELMDGGVYYSLPTHGVYVHEQGAVPQYRDLFRRIWSMPESTLNQRAVKVTRSNDIRHPIEMYGILLGKAHSELYDNILTDLFGSEDWVSFVRLYHTSTLIQKCIPNPSQTFTHVFTVLNDELKSMYGEAERDAKLSNYKNTN